MKKHNQKSKTKSQDHKLKMVKVFIALLIFYFLFVSLRDSLFFKKRDRLNIVFYGEETAFYSFGFQDGVNYFISYPADIKIFVPGGFGYYRLGALGKLVSLEKNPDIFKKAFSNTSGSFIDLYFYSPKNDIYFGQAKKVVFFPEFKDIFLKKTNASLIDRIYIFSLFLRKQKNNFVQIPTLPVKKEQGDIYFDEKKFYDDQLGFFYQESMRQEKAAVQIVYSNSEDNAVLLSKIIEGEGIRVVDISYKQTVKDCVVFEDNKQSLKTTEVLASFLDCPKKKKNTNPYDIILELGQKEKEWGS